MTTKNYLLQIERLDKMIQNKLSEINQLQHIALSVSIAPKEVNVKSSGDQDKMGTAVSKLADLEIETQHLVDTYIEKRKLIISQIDSIEDVNMYHILSEKYVARKQWKEIEVEIGKSHRYVMDLHKKSLREFERMYGKNYMDLGTKKH